MGNKANKNDKMINQPTDLFKRYLALQLYSKRDNIQGMYRNLLKLKPMYKKKPSYYYRLAKLAYRQKLWEQALTHINVAIQLTTDTSSSDFLLLKSKCFIHLGESKKAIMGLDEYVLKEPADAEAWYKHAVECRKLQRLGDAVASFKSYLQLVPKDSKVSFQLAECLRESNEYQQAEFYYNQAAKSLDQKSDEQALARSYYWLGSMQLKNDNRESAFQSFNQAISFDEKLNSQRFGIGVFHEHYKRWNDAIKAYKEKVSKNGQDAELQFKLASLFDKRHKYKEAIKYYEKALQLDKVRAEWHYALANCYELLEDYKNAKVWYQSAIDRSLKHPSVTYRRLGSVLDCLGESKNALKSYKEADLFGKPNSVDQKSYKDNITKHKVRYAISYEYYSVNQKTVFYESMGGARMMGNPYAVFDYIINHPDFKDFMHIWVVNSFDVIPTEYKAFDNIIFVKKGSDAYFKYISSAKYLICNSTFEPYVVRKSEQLYLQTSHGIFYKTVGRDSFGSPVGVAGSTRNLLQATHIIMPNEYMVDKQPKSYSIKGINQGEIAKVGYPRIDITLNLGEETKHQIRTKLGVDTSKKMVLYAPTWRGSTKADNKFDSTQLIQDLKKLAKLDANIVFRGHTITNRVLKGVKLPENIIVPQPEIQTNELLGMADILISDYSSVFFDFLVTERPVIHYLYDIEEYTKERGLNLSESELPGSVAKTSDQLIATVANKLKNDKPDARYLTAKNRFCPYDDGKSTERVVKWFFYSEYRDINLVEPEYDKSYLYLGGLLSNKSGIPELVKKMNHLKQNGNIVSIMMQRNVANDDEKLREIEALNSDINLVAHDKNMPTTIEEIQAIKYLNSEGTNEDEKMKCAYKRAFQREARRLFGDSQFHQVINYEVDSSYWTALANHITMVDA